MVYKKFDSSEMEREEKPYSFDIGVLVLFDAEGGALPFLSHKLFTVEPPR